ncbi:MAG: hypothetical protein ACM3N5_17090, partial [Candidatus Eiseniibacteriota bacterium]
STGKSAIVTGSTGGVGSSIAQILGAEGADTSRRAAARRRVGAALEKLSRSVTRSTFLQADYQVIVDSPCDISPIIK